MKNKLTDLNDHLFAQLERLGEEDIGAEELKKEIERSAAVASVATKIIDNARLVLDAERARSPDKILSSPYPLLSAPERQ